MALAKLLRCYGAQIYVDTDDDLRLSRRILRDIEHRGRDLKGVIAQYTRFVKPAQDKYVTPSRKFADVIIPWNECALSLGGLFWWKATSSRAADRSLACAPEPRVH